MILGALVFWLVIGYVCARLVGEHFAYMRGTSQGEDDRAQAEYLSKWRNK